MKLVLAPMEGVVDWVFRDCISQIGGFDFCVTEFMRVTDVVHSESDFYKICPELLLSKETPKTAKAIPIVFQFLGGHGEPLLQNALKAYELGARAIDLNFGCPANTVNRHDGGACLLQWPERLYQITSTVRSQLPEDCTLSAKMRLGYLDRNHLLENARALESAGIDWLTIHARTKSDGYKPPAYWEDLKKVKEILNIPLIANGDIFSVENLMQCREQSGCDDFMIGRGALRNPFLFKELRSESLKTPWVEIQPFLLDFYIKSTLFKSEFFAVSRMKQLLTQLKTNYTEADLLFQKMKAHTVPELFRQDLWTLNSFSAEFHELLNSKKGEVPGVFQSNSWWKDYKN